MLQAVVTMVGGAREQQAAVRNRDQAPGSHQLLLQVLICVPRVIDACMHVGIRGRWLVSRVEICIGVLCFRNACSDFPAGGGAPGLFCFAASMSMHPARHLQ
jgi:hypothetical protein